jgi:hypothetical protein
MTRARACFAACLALAAAAAAARPVAAPVHPAAAPSPAAPVFAALDTDHDGALSAREFAAGYADLQRAIALGVRLREQFRTVDTDHSGALEAGEYAALVLVRAAGASAPPLAAFDADADHRLDFAEYVALVRRLAPPAAAASTPGGH